MKPLTKLNRLAVELIPPVFFMALGFITGKNAFFIMVIVVLVAFNVFRVMKQVTTIELLKSISIKVIGKIEENSSEPKT